VLPAPKVHESASAISIDPESVGVVFGGLKGLRQASRESRDALKSGSGGIRDGTLILGGVETLKLSEGRQRSSRLLPLRV